MKHSLSLIVALLFSLVAARGANGALIINATELAGDVLIDTSGSLN